MHPGPFYLCGSRDGFKDSNNAPKRTCDVIERNDEKKPSDSPFPCEESGTCRPKHCVYPIEYKRYKAYLNEMRPGTGVTVVVVVVAPSVGPHVQDRSASRARGGGDR